MRKTIFLSSLILLSLPAVAERLSCDALKDRLDAKLQAKGVQTYTLEIVDAKTPASTAQVASGVAATNMAVKGKEVGTCDGGTKRLIYTRGN